MKRLQKHYNCPVELSLDFVGGKWKAIILAWLKEGPHRYSELRQLMPGLADKVLTERLKELEELGLVAKIRLSGSGTAQFYQLTERGNSLRPILDALYYWVKSMEAELGVRIGNAA